MNPGSLTSKFKLTLLDTTISTIQDFPGDTGNKNLFANAGDMGSITGWGRFHIPRSS